MVGVKTACALASVLLAVVGSQPTRQSGVANENVKVTRADGGAMTVHLGHGYGLNKESTLRREWIAIADDRMPATLVGTPGLDVAYVDGRVSGEYVYSASFNVDAKEPLVAIAVSFICFDAWGRHVKSLVSDDVIDVPKGSDSGKPPFRFSAKANWRIFDENEAARHYASVAYVSRVRTKSGKIVECDHEVVLAECRKVSAKFTMEQIEPSTAPK